uniref:Uncharacterized protein n=1 Tax=Rhizophora mucronata TaxID=61149 RepID=A0A2P2PLZ3_RHIMU
MSFPSSIIIPFFALFISFISTLSGYDQAYLLYNEKDKCAFYENLIETDVL